MLVSPFTPYIYADTTSTNQSVSQDKQATEQQMIPQVTQPSQAPTLVNQTTQPTIKIMQVTASKLSVRIGPGTNQRKIGSLNKGTKVEVVEQSGIWNKIKYNNGYGWCSGDYLSVVNNNNNQPNPNPTKLSKGYYIIITTSKNTMGYYKDGKLVKEFSVATGKSSTQTPKGKFKIVNKIVNRPYYKTHIPGGDPRNPLGNRWLGLSVGSTNGSTYAIHGNNNENSIGSNVSGGCVRMHNNEVRWLFEQVPIGTTVIISGSSQSYHQIASECNINVE